MMQFGDLAEVFDRLEKTSSRLEMTDILAEFFRNVKPEEIRKTIYLSVGRLHPDFVPLELGMADKLVLKAIASVSGRRSEEVEDLWTKTGDPGEVAEMLIAKKKQMTLFSEPLSFQNVIEGLTAIENASGKDSQDKKMKLLARMLHDSSPLEARYLCRIVTGRMRVGAGTMTAMDALASAFASKEDRPDIERAFNITCDMGLVAETLASGGLDAVKGIEVSVGNPVKVMLAERLRSLPEIMERLGGKCAFEYKYDGIRVQAHIKKGPGGFVKLFSRRLEDLTSNFPDIGEALLRQLKGREAIVEGECVAYDPDTGTLQPFQNVTHRRKKHGMEKAVEDIPVRIFLFDMLYCDGEDYTLKPYSFRRMRLESSFKDDDSERYDRIGYTSRAIIDSDEKAQKFFDGAIAARCEGIMAKSLSEDSVYRAGSRGFLWIKYKKDYTQALVDSFDLTVVGAFYGMGKRAGKYGALLMAAYDPDTGRFGTACKLGTGFDDAFLDAMPGLLEKYRCETKPASLDAEMVPDVWFIPGVVLEVTAADISLSPIHTIAYGTVKEDAGLGLRFPRFTGRVRDDKTPEQCTTASEIVEFYRMQEDRDNGDVE
ncbi:MAG: ATP-dependent DNA ligase [Methanomethylophilus alvi]|uniref:ATP-dependent DNA ligase n=1 Tax=Methanomethylophilus alvi TaxID=1291540 RepID=UPI002AA27977|nr:ATP-dependent DNA ligase [Methanomethylophilus alvi]